MLQIEHVNKEYHTGKLVQRALSDVTVNLRDNEFVSILGPSGSGKTTFLNVIGGLDRYDSGNLVIDGVSTQEYTDRDWDAYRNHKVGFVFQSYNLITHQTILANVELALTIAGVGRKERRERAMQALERVGLAEQAHKLPAQLSGGQMQRVAIARALVNDPDILLADEPTGALDSETSLQVMELLREVAEDRLVVLVTHNAELAETYSTRIIRLNDGAITDDTDPYEPGEKVAYPAAPAPVGRSSMSLFTSMALSFRNLGTKRTRTILTAIAGSIGIIGIALILAISSGVNRYVDIMEADMVKEYPIEINRSYYNVMAYVSARGGSLLSDADEDEEIYDERTVDISALIYNIFSGQASNDLVSLRDYLEYGGTGIEDYVTCIEYDFGITPQIYQDNTDSVVQVHPDHFFDILGFGSTISTNDIMTSLVDTDAFFQMPESEELYQDSYTVRAGRWPESWDECVLVLHEGSQTTDIGLYMMDLRDISEMEAMIDQFARGEEVEQPVIDETYTVDDFLGITFKLVNNTDLYAYDETYGVWTDKSDDEAYMQRLVNRGETLTIVGVVELNEGEDSGILSAGFNYTPELVDHLAEEAAKSEIVQQQMANPDINVLTGEPFGEEETEEFDLSTLFTIDEEAMAELFPFDEESLSDLLSGSSLDMTSSAGLSGLLSSLRISTSEEDLIELGTDLLSGYQSYVAGDPSADLTGLADAFTEYLQTNAAQQILLGNLSSIIRSSGGLQVSTENISSLYQDLLADLLTWASNEGYSSVSDVSDHLDAYLATSGAQSILTAWTEENLSFDLSGVTISEEQLSTLSAELVAGYEAYAKTHAVPDPEKIGSSFVDYLGSSEAEDILTDSLLSMVDLSGVESQMQTYLTREMEQVASTIGESLVLDPEEFLEAIDVDMDAMDLLSLLSSLIGTSASSYEGNLAAFGYTDFTTPDSIKIYPKDFASKDVVVEILDAYNAQMEETGQEHKEVSYSESLGSLMGLITEIVNILSYVLIAFVAISLVVSCIMIGVITYISVLERKKEIGILRAIGASKRNISQVFNAETFLVGLAAGVLGIVVTLLLILPINAVIHNFSGIYELSAYLPVGYALLLILLSVVLTLLSGMIPSTKASRSDPVEALRSE